MILKPRTRSEIQTCASGDVAVYGKVSKLGKKDAYLTQKQLMIANGVDCVFDIL